MVDESNEKTLFTANIFYPESARLCSVSTMISALNTHHSLASLLYTFLISAWLACLDTPRTLQGSNSGADASESPNRDRRRMAQTQPFTNTLQPPIFFCFMTDRIKKQEETGASHHTLYSQKYSSGKEDYSLVTHFKILANNTEHFNRYCPGKNTKFMLIHVVTLDNMLSCHNRTCH